MEYNPIIKRDTYVALPETSKKLAKQPTYPHCHLFQSTPWKIDMEPTNDPFGKEKLSSKPPRNYVQNVNLQVYHVSTVGDSPLPQTSPRSSQ